MSRAFPWLGVLTAVWLVFFFEHLFLGRSILPLDVLNQMMMPRSPEDPISVQTHYPVDEITQLLPNAAFWREQVRAGDWPLWNPHFYGGHPQQASSIWGILSPFKLILLLPISLERAYTGGLAFQFWCAGVGMFWFLRQRGRSPMASCFGGCIWMLSSNFIMFHWLYLNVFVWLPPALAAWDRMLAAAGTHPRLSLRWGWLNAVFLALAMTGGSIQFAVFSGFWWGVYAVGGFAFDGPRAVRAGLARLFGVFGLAFCLSLPQFLPLAEFLPLETWRFRILEPGAFGWRHSLLGPIAGIATFLVPGLAGSPSSFDLLKAIGGNQIDFNGYIGWIPWLLVAAGWRCSHDSRRPALAALVIIPAILVFFTPLQKFLYHRFLLLGVFAAVVIASAAWDGLVNGLIPLPRWNRIVRNAAFGMLLLWIGLGVFQRFAGPRREALVRQLSARILAESGRNQFGVFPEWLKGRVPKLLDHFSPRNPVFWVPTAGACIAGVLAWSLERRRISPAAAFRCWMLIVLADVSWTLRDRVPRVDMATSPFYPDCNVLKAAREDSDRFRIHRWCPKSTLLLHDNVLWAKGFDSVTGYDSLLPDGMRLFALGDTNGFSRLLDLVAAKYVVTDDSVSLAAPRFEKVGVEKNAILWRNREWLQKLSWVPQARGASSKTEALEWVQRSDFDPRTEVILENKNLAETPPGDAKATKGSIRWLRGSARSIEAEVVLDGNGWLVLAENFYPGWRVTVDDVPREVLRADGVLMAVGLPAGTHRVMWQFDPPRFRLGLWLAALGGVGGLLATRWAPKFGSRIQ